MNPNVLPAVALALALVSGGAQAEKAGYAVADLPALSIAKFELADRDGDGFLTGEEAASYKALETVLAKADTDEDGRLSRAEFWSAVNGKPWG